MSRVQGGFGVGGRVPLNIYSEYGRCTTLRFQGTILDCRFEWGSFMSPMSYTPQGTPLVLKGLGFMGFRV